MLQTRREREGGQTQQNRHCRDEDNSSLLDDSVLPSHGVTKHRTMQSSGCCCLSEPKLCFAIWEDNKLLRLELFQDAVDLAGVDIESGFGPNDEMSEGHLFMDRPLGADALLDF